LGAFTPHVEIGGEDFPVALSDAAKLLGVDHFNWKNRVTIPFTWKAEIDTGTTFVPLDPPDTKELLDPIPVRGPSYLLTNLLNDELAPIANDYDKDGNLDTDDHPFYFAEGIGGIADVRNPRWTKTDRLVFEDSPGFEKDFNPGLLKVFFETELVGVVKNSDGTLSEKPTHLGYRWSSNTIWQGFAGIEPLGYLSNVNPSNLGTIVGGGISDIEAFRPVPEPSTGAVALFFGAAASCFLRIRQLRSYDSRCQLRCSDT